MTPGQIRPNERYLLVGDSKADVINVIINISMPYVRLQTKSVFVFTAKPISRISSYRFDSARTPNELIEQDSMIALSCLRHSALLRPT